jgi:hypothetical protein
MYQTRACRYAKRRVEGWQDKRNCVTRSQSRWSFLPDATPITCADDATTTHSPHIHPRRPDPRRGNAIGAQHRTGRARRGQVETIAARRVLAFELRKAGSSYREIARELRVDVHTIHGDIQA